MNAFAGEAELKKIEEESRKAGEAFEENIRQSKERMKNMFEANRNMKRAQVL